MARANRHHIPGQVWHITHRCHKKEFLLKFAKDRRRWHYWLFEAKDLNMVRAGVVSHPAEWALSGYNEIQNPPERYGVIDRPGLQPPCGFSDPERFAESDPLQRYPPFAIQPHFQDSMML